MLIENIEDLLAKMFEEKEFSDCFLVDISIVENKVEVFVESDEGITLGRCQKISRFLEAYLDSASEIATEYIVEVSSPGVDRPLKKQRQFPIHLDRTIEISMRSGKTVKGILKAADEGGIKVELTVIVKEKKKKKKMIEIMKIEYSDIEEAKVMAII